MTRVLSGIVMAAGALAAIVFLPAMGMRLVAALIAAVATFEYVGLIGVDDQGGRGAYAFMAGLAAWELSSNGTPGLVALLAFFVAGLNAMFVKRGTGQQAILGAFSMLYIGMPLGLLAALNIGRGWRATVLLIATVPISIAGWGVRESSMMAAFAYAGLAESDGLTLSILFGAVSFVIGIIGGIVWISSGFRTATFAPTVANGEIAAEKP